MTVAQLSEALSRLPDDAVVLMAGDGGITRVAEIDPIDAQGLLGAGGGHSSAAPRARRRNRLEMNND